MATRRRAGALLMFVEPLLGTVVQLGLVLGDQAGSLIRHWDWAVACEVAAVVDVAITVAVTAIISNAERRRH